VRSFAKITGEGLKIEYFYDTCLLNTVIFTNFRSKSRMKKLIPIFTILFIILAAPSCKKAIEKKQECCKAGHGKWYMDH
jgi:hypothetical protein